MPAPTPVIIAEPRVLLIEGPLILQPAGNPFVGTGQLSGSSPFGLATVNSVPSRCEIRVHYRPPASSPYADGVLVAKTVSDLDGTWLVSGLDMNKRFDVVARRAGYRDIIVSDVAPYRPPSTQNCYPRGHTSVSPGKTPCGHILIWIV